MPFHPELILLFGSQAKGTAGESSDVDLCVVADTADKRRFAAGLETALDLETAVDIIVYTPSEWKLCSADRTSFAYKIMKEGRVLYAGQQALS